MQTVQQQKMKLVTKRSFLRNLILRYFQTDARVGAVTETMNVIRMIKLFGWESRMHEKLAAKRDDELKLQRKRLFLELFNNTIKCVDYGGTRRYALTLEQFCDPYGCHDRYIRVLCEFGPTDLRGIC